MPTINQLVREGRARVKGKNKSPALTECPQRRGVCVRVYTTTPKKPNSAELQIIKEMFEASVDGEAYDPARWGQYFKPAGLNQNTGDPVTPAPAQVSKPTPAPVADESLPWDEPAPAQPVVNTVKEETTTPSAENRAADILQAIRNRNASQ